MSRFTFAIPTIDEAGEFLAWRRRKDEYQAELYADAIACERALLPVTSRAERAAAARSIATGNGPTFACAVCGKWAFMRPTICFWCAKEL